MFLLIIGGVGILLAFIFLLLTIKNIKFIWLCLISCAVSIIIFIISMNGLGGSSNESTTTNNDSDNQTGGKFGYGEQYDKDVYYVADQFYS